ncbi:MAG: acyltransferase family protein [Planctomycetota bacterium]|jgi:predicted acyltransferase
MSGSKKPGPVKNRVTSLDALRGFDMFWIIGGGRIFNELLNRRPNSEFSKALLSQLKHVEWEGFHAWDLIMPLFLFIVGAAMPFSLNKRLARGDSRRKLYFHIVKRAIILSVLGIVAQGDLLAYDLPNLHIYGYVLGAIAAGYLVSSIIMLNMRILWQMITTAGLLLLFWALMSWVPVPSYSAGVLTPDENLAIYLDKMLLGRWGETGYASWILSIITFTCTVMLGVFAGQLLRSQKSKTDKVLWLLAAAIGCLLLGLIWGNWFPIIKRLWTSSFVLFAAGWSYLLLALFYLVIDVWQLRKWAFGFVVIGTNAIAVYVAVHLFDFKNIGNIFVVGLSRFLGQWNDFVQELTAFAVIWLILFCMYRKKTFIKI